MGTAQSLLEKADASGAIDGEPVGLKTGLKGFKNKHNARTANKCVDETWQGTPSSNGHNTTAEKHAAAVKGDRPSKATSFLAWAKRQSKQRSKTIEQFLVDSAQLHDQPAVNAAQAVNPAQSAPSPAAAACKASTCQHSSPDTSALQDVLTVLTSDQQQEQQQQHVPVLQPFEPHNGYVRGPPKPHCHEARVVAADGIQALRRTRDGELESMLRLLCKVFDVETATCALLTGHAIYITAACGALQSCVCPDRWGFCGWSFLNSHHELLVVEDMDKDARFCANFFVCDPNFNLKFYVAAPLISSNGHRLGTLCVMGQEAHKFDAMKGQVLANLAEMLVRQLEEKWVNALQSFGQCQGLLRATSCYSSAYLVLDLSSRPWRVLHMNEPAIQATGATWEASYAELACYADGRREKAAFEGMPLDMLFDVSQARLTWTNSGSWEFTLSGLALINSSSSDGQRYSLTCKPASADGLDEDQPFYVGVPGWLALSESNTWGKNYFFARLEPKQQQQQVQFAGDSVEQLTPMRAGHGAARVGGMAGTADAVAGAANSSSSNAVSSGSNSGGLITLPAGAPAAAGAPTDYMWYPRGFTCSVGRNAANSGSNVGSSGSNASPTAAGSSPLSSSRSLGSWGMSAPVSSSISSSERNSLDCASSARNSIELLPKIAPSVVSVATSNSGSSGVASGSSGALSSCVGSLVRGLPIPGLVMGPLLGRGSYGRVYRGLLKGRPVAVKIIDDVGSLRLNSAGEPLEISLTRDLRQTGIMSTLGYAYADAAATPNYSRGSSKHSSRGSAGGRAMRGGGTRTCWMLFEYCDKGILVDAVIRGWFRTSRNPLTGAPHLRVIGLTALEIAAAMQHLHAKDVLHGDLCGGNVMLTASASAPHGFTAKVGDFGLVRTAAAAAAAADDSGEEALHPVEQRLASNAYGTITHQPPEVLLEGSAAFTAAADVYAWGVLLWEMLTGSRAWAGMSAPSVVVQVAVLKRSLAVPPALPPALNTLLTGALNLDPLQRPTFDVIVEQLTSFVQQSRAVDWEQWQRAVDAAHAQEAAVIKAADAAAAEAPAGEEDAGEEARASTGVACSSCPVVAGRAQGLPA